MRLCPSKFRWDSVIAYIKCSLSPWNCSGCTCPSKWRCTGSRSKALVFCKIISFTNPSIIDTWLLIFLILEISSYEFSLSEAHWHLCLLHKIHKHTWTYPLKSLKIPQNPTKSPWVSKVRSPLGVFFSAQEVVWSATRDAGSCVPWPMSWGETEGFCLWENGGEMVWKFG